MKQPNAFQPFSFSSFQKIHSLTLGDLKWTAFEHHDFLGDGDDWEMLIENMLTEKNPELLNKLTLCTEHDMFCIRSEDRDALHEIAEMVFKFYDDDLLLDACIKRYAQYDFVAATNQ
ncbi:hypothetical protein E2R68_08565 [Psychromonas sp. RZ22]|uniref:Imm51 family immunity protein n=1 Tax=Psychromonas algarum TaxID=2555643 RepID=UPI001067CD7D|nr:Imm51 family immunity protein [Psychromonas sp. RZ22]TEW54316.1 hypothetical protein E2R68_08565 [Psychromonas sp. RZ22]